MTPPVYTLPESMVSAFLSGIGVPVNVSVSLYIPGAWPYIQRAVGCAQKHGLQHTTVDLHDGAPGSQTRYDNLGQRTSSPQCALQSENVDATLAIIQVIASELGPVVDAIELLNEVASFYGEAWVGHRRARVLEERIRGREANGGRRYPHGHWGCIRGYDRT
jgi:hypothetical protein